MNLKIKPLSDKFQPPRYATAGSAAFDFHAIEAGCIISGEVAKISLGCAVELPQGKALLITARSGHGAKYGAGVPHGYGLIDSDYRGELFMIFVTEVSFAWEAGDRICQGMIISPDRARFDIVEELSETDRGVGGFGSTGSK